MTRIALIFAFFALANPSWASSAYILSIEGPIGPATAAYVHQGFAEAAKAQAALIVLEMDTPGGLDTSMRSIIQDIINAPIPVVGYVYPPGARAASAGTYILYACHIAAMAPGTNLGAATPIHVTGLPLPAGKAGEKRPAQKAGLHEKIVNDAVAYIRSLAEMHGRNADWAEKAVRQAASLSSKEALKAKVIDLIAEDIADLLKKIDGKRVRVQGKDRRIETAALSLHRFQPDWRNRMLAVITNPNVAYLLMLLGFYGILFELMNPGYVLPGVVGAICLLLALFAFHVLPINYTGLALVLLGIAFMIAEAFVPSFGALGLGGLIAFVIGSIMFLEPGVPGYGISYWLIAAVSLTSALFFILVLGMALKARRRPVVSGREEMLGLEGVAIQRFRKGKGKVKVHGEIWNAVSNQELAKGEPVRVKRVHGLTLEVERIDQGGKTS